MHILYAECQEDDNTQQVVIFSLFDVSWLHNFQHCFDSDHCLGNFGSETPIFVMLLFFLKTK